MLVESQERPGVQFPELEKVYGLDFLCEAYRKSRTPRTFLRLLAQKSKMDIYLATEGVVWYNFAKLGLIPCHKNKA